MRVLKRGERKKYLNKICKDWKKHQLAQGIAALHSARDDTKLYKRTRKTYATVPKVRKRGGRWDAGAAG